MKRGRTEPMRGGGEHDALTGWRRLLCVFHNNTGLARWWKRRYNRRVRRTWRQKLTFIGILLIGAAFLFGIAAAECPLIVAAGDTVELRAYYVHQGAPGGVLYTATDIITPLTNGTAEAFAEGHPVGFGWYVNGQHRKTCGVEPIFNDGFRTGDLSRWQTN